jgi:serine/threonine protein phosphatase PrpC
MAVVCDGVGGLSYGEVASATVVQGFSQWFEHELPTLLDAMDQAFDFGVVQSRWQRLLCDLNDRIRQYGRSIGALLGTTFTGMLACDGTYVVGHVGDSRAYCLHDGVLNQITEDQTLLAYKLAHNQISPQEVKHFTQRNVILQSVGTEQKLAPAFYTGSMDDLDVMVLCSDGAYHVLGSQGLERAFQGASCWNERRMGDACEHVLEKSMSGGEKDNLSIVCLRCESGLAHGETDDELGIPGLMGKLRMMASTAEDLQ